MSTFDTKCKDTDPTNTILNIIDFFKSHGFTIEEFNPYKAESHTYSISLALKYKNYLINYSHGKGATPEFARASGYAEMYERYATRLKDFFNVGFSTDFINTQKREKGYYIDKNEKELTFEELCAENDMLYNYYKNIVGEKNIKTLFNILTNNHYIGIPFNNFYDNSIKYFDPRILYKLTTSNGLASGNTYEEACVQGISELFERYVEFKMFDNLDFQYAELDLTTLKNPILQNMIASIKNANNNIKIYDLSYAFHLPVIASAIFNRLNSRIYLNFGSAPEFDIAIERVITETYQGLKTLNFFDDTIQRPAKTSSADDIVLKQGGNSSFTICQFPETFFLNTNKVPCYQSPYFLYDNNMSNTELLNWYRKLAKDLNLVIYIHDYSLTKNMAAIQAFITNINTQPAKEKLYKDLSPIIKDKNVELLQNYISAYKNIKANDYNAFKNNWSKILQIVNQYPTDLGAELMMSDWIIPFYMDLEVAPLLFFNPDMIINGLAGINTTFLFEPFKRIATIREYKNVNYTNKQIIEIFKNFGVDVSTELNLDNQDEIIKYAIFDNLRKVYADLEEIYMAMLGDL